MTINPYELLGIDPHTSTLKDLKKRYYEFALLVHPDKNNVQNGDDMHIVHMAYKYCQEQMQLAKDKETTVENLETEFEEFCKIQTEAPPPFRDIMEDALELKKFNETFEKDSECFRAAFQNGYGDYMEPSLHETIGESNLDIVNERIGDFGYSTIEDNPPPPKNDFSSLIVYTEPISTTTTGDFYDYNRKEPISSYTVYMKKTCLTDYKEANTTQEIEDPLFVDKENRSYDDLVAEREKQNEILDGLTTPLL
jgi:hypothetical protein